MKTLALSSLVALALLAARPARAEAPGTALAPNPALPAGTGRVLVSFPTGTGTRTVAILLFPAGAESRPVARAEGSMAAAVAPGAYAVSVNGIWVTGVEVRAQADTSVRVGVLRLTAPGGSTTEVRRQGREHAVRFRGGGDIGLPVGEYEVATGDQRTLLTIAEGRVTPWGPRPAAPAPTGAGAMVSLEGQDLAAVDAWISASRNPQWIVGDQVEVVASREYFSTQLTVNVTQGGYVRRTDQRSLDETVVTLTFLGAPSSASILTNPRVMIGTGLTISARRTLVVRLQRTTDPSVPVRLRVTARGQASRGRHEQVLHRADAITIGGTLRRREARWSWETL